MLWGCLSPSFHVFSNLSSCSACALFVMGMVGKGSPPSPGKKSDVMRDVIVKCLYCVSPGPCGLGRDYLLLYSWKILIGAGLALGDGGS